MEGEPEPTILDSIKAKLDAQRVFINSGAACRIEIHQIPGQPPKLNITLFDI